MGFWNHLNWACRQGKCVNAWSVTWKSFVSEISISCINSSSFQPSPAVYEHTFPPNCISEMPSGVAFPNRGDFMDTLKENRLSVGVVFIAVSEVRQLKHSFRV